MGFKCVLAVFLVLLVNVNARRVIVFRRAAEIHFPKDANAYQPEIVNPSSELKSGGDVSSEFACVSCLQLSRKVESMLSDPAVLEKAHGISTDICNLLPSDLKEKCLEMSEVYLNQAIAFLQGYFSEDNLCNSTGLCPETAKHLAKSSFTEEKQISDERSCTTCRNAIAQLQDDISNPETKLKLMRALMKVCENVENHVKECKRLVFKYGPLILANLDKYLSNNDFCCQLHLCNSTNSGTDKTSDFVAVIKMPGTGDSTTPVAF